MIWSNYIPSSLQIVTREDKLIAFLCRYVRATLTQCTRYDYSASSASHVRKILNSLIDAGFVAAHRGFSQDGRPPFVYSPTLKGWQYAKDHHDMPVPARWRAEEAKRQDFRDFLHDLAITDFGIAVEHFCREADPVVRFARFIHDRMLPQTKVGLPDGSRKALRLDGFVDLRIQRDEGARTVQRAFLIEVDRGTHFERAIREKIELQYRYQQGGHNEADFGTPSLTYLWVCPDRVERVRKLRKIAEATLAELGAADYGPLFLFTPANPATVDPIDLFVRPSWSVPFRSEPVALLSFPAAVTTVRLERPRYLPAEQYERFLMATGEGLPTLRAEVEVE